MDLHDLNRHVGEFLRNKTPAEKGVACGVQGLFAFESIRPTPVEATLYVPIACLTLQGTKETTVGSRSHRFPAGETVIVSHDLPVTSRVTEASPDHPYRALVLLLDVSLLRSLYDQLGDTAPEEDGVGAIEVAVADEGFTDALARYFLLARNPIEARVLGPLIYKELHFRLLVARHGRMLRRLLHLDSYASRVGRAIAHIRQNYQRQIAVPDLARIAGMSGSSFHAHFRAITETTPLQYQKDLRLIEARRLLSEQGQQVSATAFEIGYESPTQFSRDYARKFGASPRNDIRAAN